MSTNMNVQVNSINTPSNSAPNKVAGSSHSGTREAVSSVQETKPANIDTDGKTLSPDFAKALPDNPKGQQTDKSDVSQAVNDLNDYVQNTQRQLNFSINEETGQTVIKVIDTETQETVRQIPSEEIVALAQQMRKNNESKGNLFQTEV